MSSDITCSTITSKDNFREAERFLRSRDVAHNAHLLYLMQEAASCPDTRSILLVRQNSKIIGVACLNETKESPDWDFAVMMDAKNDAAVRAILDVLPKNLLGYFRIHRVQNKHSFQRLQGVRCLGVDLAYSVTKLSLEPVVGDAVIEIEPEDALRISECEHPTVSSLDQIGTEGQRAFAIVRDTKIASSVVLRPILSGPQRDRSVAAVTMLHTDEEYRGMGLGKRLASYVSELALQDHHCVLYWTRPENTASQKLAIGLGYWHYGMIVDYIWRSECIQSTP